MSEFEKIELNEEELDQVNGGGLDPERPKGHVQIVNCDVVNVRDAAGGGKVIGRARCGARLEYYGTTNGWARVKAGSVIGYVYKTYFKVVK